MDNYDKLKEQLDLQEWPGVFLFKFIVPNTPEKIALVTALTDDSAELNLQPSKNGKYVSVSSKELMMSSKAIIERYKAAAKIEGLIAL